MAFVSRRSTIAKILKSRRHESSGYAAVTRVQNHSPTPLITQNGRAVLRNGTIRRVDLPTVQKRFAL